ncbi:MAG TPA: methionyl-tRNA formyltransferase, partial [Anaerolineales bacterium]|nr:methionyl-tRNA formyltransferase [Anaerolineales bacterium]
FFGSFQHYSALILQSLINTKEINVVSVVTTPPMPTGRKQIITKTPVHTLANQYSIPVLTPENLLNKPALPTIPKPDFFITAGYGKIFPKSWLNYPKHDSLNLHFSLLPNYRGANPAEWAIMCGESKTGITLIKMNSKLDGGDIVEQRELPITATDTRKTLYQKLYELGAKELPDMVIRYHQRIQKNQFACQQSLAPKSQPAKSPTPYAALLKRNDGYLPWSTIQKFLKKQSLEPSDFPSKHFQNALMYYLERNGLQSEHAQPNAFRQSIMQDYKPSIEKFISNLPRALADYPSLWTIVSTKKGDKRMKILKFKPLTVQIEGKQPSLFNQIKNQILISNLRG